MAKDSQKQKPTRMIGLRRGPAGWSVVECLVQDGKVLKEKTSEPELRAIALEQFARATNAFWMDE
jgi:hypothetical protein